MGYVAGLHAAVSNSEHRTDDIEPRSPAFSDDCNVRENDTDGLLVAMNDGNVEGVKEWAEGLGSLGYGKEVFEDRRVVQGERRSTWGRFWPPPCKRLKGSI